MNVYCQLGLGNRLTTIAATLKEYKSINYHWRKNRDLRDDHKSLFPNGVPNVNFIDIDHLRFSTGIRGKMAYDYFDNVDYLSVMDCLVGEAHCKPIVTIHGRFHRKVNQNHLDLLALLPKNTEEVFVLCDSKRELIYNELQKRNIKIIHPKSKEMMHDFDRNENDILPFISDWKSLCNSQTIITNCPQSSALHPARQSKAIILTNLTSQH